MSIFAEKSMKRLVWLLIIFFIVLVGITFLKNLSYFSPAEKQSGFVVEHHFDDSIRIAYIGDSWAGGHKAFKCIIDTLVCNAVNRPVIVKTAGINGLTSKNIYYSMFRNKSMRRVIEWGPDFCFVVAGINDTNRKMGKLFYKENMRLIVDFLLENHITPIILEIPSYDIRFAFRRTPRQTKLVYLLSMFLNCSKFDCIEDYRNAYVNLIDEQGWSDKVITISYMEWNPDGYKDVRGLYDGGLMHLNKKGYLVLDSCIANKIIYHLSGQRF